MGRMKILLAALVAALAAAPCALADGYAGPAAQLGEGVVWNGPDGPVRFVAAPAFDNTSLLAIDAKSGMIVNEAEILGRYGIPILSFGPRGYNGLSADGRTLVLGDTSFGKTSNFLLYETRTLRFVNGFSVPGTFVFDALSPDRRTAFLIQYRSELDQTHYVVRAYDLRARRLLPGRIADRAQKGWVMQGTAITRTSSTDGRWVYTLYANPGGYPFVHALDTVGRTAHCVGLPWAQASQDGLWNLALVLHGRGLDVRWKSGKPLYRVDTATWRVSRPAAPGRDWWWIAAGGSILLVALAMERNRRRRRRTTVSVEGGSDGTTARSRGRSVPRRRRADRARRIPVAVRGTGRSRRRGERRHALRGAQGAVRADDAPGSPRR